MKRCTDCGISKPLSEFDKNDKTKNHLDYICKSCKNEKRVLLRLEMSALYSEGCTKMVWKTKFAPHRVWLRQALIRCVDTTKTSGLISAEKLVKRLNIEAGVSPKVIPVGVREKHYKEWLDWLHIYIHVCQYVGMKDGLPLPVVKEKKPTLLFPLVNEAMRLTTSFYLKETPSHYNFQTAIKDHVEL